MMKFEFGSRRSFSDAKTQRRSLRISRIIQRLMILSFFRRVRDDSYSEPSSCMT